MAKKQQRFTQKPTVFEPTQEEIDAVLADVFAEMDKAERERAELAKAQEDELRADVEAIAEWLADDEVTEDTQPDYVTCAACGGAFGFGTSYEPNAEICHVCGNVLGTYDDDEYDWSDWYPTDDELSEETQPIPPLSERAEIVDEAIREDERLARENHALEMLAADAERLREDEIRDLEQVGLAWWLDIPIPFELTPLAEDFLRKLGR